MSDVQESLPPIFRLVVAACESLYPDVHWEMREKEIGRHSVVYKLIGEAHGVRTFEPISRMQDDAYILELATSHARTIVDRIERVRHK